MTDAEVARHAAAQAADDAYLARVAEIHARYKRGEATRAETEVSLNANLVCWRLEEREEKARCR